MRYKWFIKRKSKIPRYKLADATYPDGCRTTVYFSCEEEYKLYYYNYFPNDERDYITFPDLQHTTDSAKQVIALANALIAGYRFAKWYYTLYDHQLKKLDQPKILWNLEQE